MSAYGAKQLAESFRTVRRNTVQIAEDIPEDKYEFIAADGVQSVSALLRHLVYSPTLYEGMHSGNPVTTLKGYDFGAAVGQMKAREDVPRTKAEIIGLLKSEGERIASWMESLSPEFLAETFTDPTGENPRSRLESLLSPKEHEMHHRGQLMLIERMIGVVPHLTRARLERMRPAAT
ncbi:MAG: DinB family protein [bacterium]